MKFLLDAQLPARLARFLSRGGHDALHTTDLPDGNRTTDARIAELADDQGRVVVTKDRDFRDGHLLSRSPQRLLVGRKGWPCTFESQMQQGPRMCRKRIPLRTGGSVVDAAAVAQIRGPTGPCTVVPGRPDSPVR